MLISYSCIGFYNYLDIKVYFYRSKFECVPGREKQVKLFLEPRLNFQSSGLRSGKLEALHGN